MCAVQRAHVPCRVRARAAALAGSDTHMRRMCVAHRHAQTRHTHTRAHSYWGEDGYIRIARTPDDCGITAQPLYLDLKKVKRGDGGGDAADDDDDDDEHDRKHMHGDDDDDDDDDDKHKHKHAHAHGKKHAH